MTAQTEIAQSQPRPAGRKLRRLSSIFARLAAERTEPVSIAEILDALGNRSFAALLVLFAAVNMLPLPPGGTTILGFPLVIVAAQLMYGSKRAWLPDFVATKSLSAQQFRAIMDRVVPRLAKLERFVRPRYWPFWRRRGNRAIGSLAFVLAVIVTLPIPFGNLLPAFSIALLGLALAERDGVVLALGGLFTVISLGLVALVVSAAGVAAHFALGWMF
ncbi:MAG: exopolysaccharide biosynthesis protein [Rhizobiaceae bacterium]|nr:exopolysaccharide biosynthesis protein [Rhizobiaceae bacterium]